MNTTRLGQKIAIVGAGISGLGAALALDRRHDVTLVEKRGRLGGHSATVDIDYDGEPLAVDTGFIVYNDKNYPNLIALFQHLNVATEKSNMSFAVSLDNGRFEWGNPSLGAIFAQRLNALSPPFLWMFREIIRFNGQVLKDRDLGHLDGASLGDYLAYRRYSATFRDAYLLPMCGAIWSTPCSKMLDFPARPFIDFLDNHNIIRPRQVPEWRTVTGGSRSYVSAARKAMNARILTDADVKSIQRNDDGVTLVMGTGDRLDFDQVILACHSDQALALLAEPSDLERASLAQIPYRPNQVYLHRDAALMPRRTATWSAWNYMSDQDADDRMYVSYWMNRLQNIDPAKPVFVSLNPVRPPREDLTFQHMVYDHPQFDRSMMAARKSLLEWQGENRTWYCGAWTGFGFHEDGLRSGLTVAEALGGAAPWAAADFDTVRQLDTDVLEAAE